MGHSYGRCDNCDLFDKYAISEHARMLFLRLFNEMDTLSEENMQLRAEIESLHSDIQELRSGVTKVASQCYTLERKQKRDRYNLESKMKAAQKKGSRNVWY